MNYKKIYEQLVDRGRNRKLAGYSERHHIIPRCLGGADSEDNLVDLTPEEHYLAHQLLVKIHPSDDRLVYAARMMVPKRPSNKYYGWLRRRYHNICKKRIGENNPSYGKLWFHNVETGESKKFGEGEVPVGWAKGRKPKTKTCKHCQKSFTPVYLEQYCSDKCKQYKASEAIELIDENLDAMVDLFVELKSITAVLREFNISSGNRYLSTILKSKGFTVLKRRNTR